MLYRSLCLFLLAFTPSINALHATTSKEAVWQKQTPSDRFLPFSQLSKEVIIGYREQLIPYLVERGVSEENEVAIEALFRTDLHRITQALSILFEQNVTNVLHKTFGSHYPLIEGYDAHIDHVGMELYGPISFYLPIINQAASQLRLAYVNDLVFPSTQVVKVLQRNDPEVKGVTIGRVYLQNLDNPTNGNDYLREEGEIRCIELFQASLLDGRYPQKIDATKQRLALLTATRDDSNLTPIDHISVELSSVEEVKKIHQRIHQLACNTLQPYQENISYNPGDGSTQTKVLMRISPEAPFNRIVEFVHYSK